MHSVSSIGASAISRRQFCQTALLASAVGAGAAYAKPVRYPLAAGESFWLPELSPAGPVVVVVNLHSQLLQVYRNGIAIGMAHVSTGKPGHGTPVGVFYVLEKKRHHRSSTYNNAPMPWMLRLTWQGVALHAGAQPGYPASHGCIRLPYDFAPRLFSVVNKGDCVMVLRQAATSGFAPINLLAPVNAQGQPTVLPEMLAQREYWTGATALHSVTVPASANAAMGAPTAPPPAPPPAAAPVAMPAAPILPEDMEAGAVLGGQAAQTATPTASTASTAPPALSVSPPAPPPVQTPAGAPAPRTPRYLSLLVSTEQQRLFVVRNGIPVAALALGSVTLPEDIGKPALLRWTDAQQWQRADGVLTTADTWFWQHLLHTVSPTAIQRLRAHLHTGDTLLVSDMAAVNDAHSAAWDVAARASSR